MTQVCYYCDNPPDNTLLRKLIVNKLIEHNVLCWSIILRNKFGETKSGGELMGEKHPDRTSEWHEQQQALKDSNTVKNLSPKHTNDADKNRS